MEIEALLPQRHPFLFVDELTEVSPEKIMGVKTYTADFLFYQELWPGERIVPPAILIESVIQCGGAGATRLGIFPQSRWGLAGLDNVHIYDWIRANETAQMMVRTSKASYKALKQTGVILCKEKKIAEANWLLLRLK
jgi:3-hydroxyacyl-[acyl-carrier-protein] dehydratase